MNDQKQIQDDSGELGGYNLLMSSLSKLDERALVLTLAAFAEESLGNLLKSFMRPNKAAKKVLEGFNAPLGSFSARIQISYALGLITDKQYEDLERLRKIRNEYAHSWKDISFSDDRISSLIKAINYSPFSDYPETALEKVRSAFSWLLMEIRVAASAILKGGKCAEVIGFSPRALWRVRSADHASQGSSLKFGERDSASLRRKERLFPPRS